MKKPNIHRIYLVIKTKRNLRYIEFNPLIDISIQYETLDEIEKAAKKTM